MGEKLLHHTLFSRIAQTARSVVKPAFYCQKEQHHESSAVGIHRHAFPFIPSTASHCWASPGDGTGGSHSFDFGMLVQRYTLCARVHNCSKFIVHWQCACCATTFVVSVGSTAPCSDGEQHGSLQPAKECNCCSAMRCEGHCADCTFTLKMMWPVAQHMENFMTHCRVGSPRGR